MKTLKQHGMMVVVHAAKNGVITRKGCVCGRIHLLMKQPENKYIACRCGRYIEL